MPGHAEGDRLSRRDDNEFDRRVMESTGAPLFAERVSIVQVNIGLTCNLSCVHCHVASSPRRKEQMDWETMEHVLRISREVGCTLVDITGGAPEMNPHFKRLVRAARAEGFPAQVRTNLTILREPGYEDYGTFLADHGVGLVASMPCYLEENVDAQRGEGVYRGSVKALLALNALGYGRRPDLPLDLVYNPLGPHLPPDETGLERDYKRELRERFGIEFTRLITITNMPIGRYLSRLKKAGQADDYRAMLEQNFNPLTINGLMCRHQINIDWNGDMYDCDFNLALRLKVDHGMPTHVRDFDAALHTRRIETGTHCFGCTAGRGSSCGGALL